MSYLSVQNEEFSNAFKSRIDWEKFVYRGEIPRSVRKIVLDSWERCSRMKVDPFSRKIARVISPEQLSIRKKRRKSLINISKPYITTLYKAVEESGFIILLTDEEGVILFLSGDPIELERYKNINLVEGAIWSEKEAGTNAVGTAISIGEPVQIAGYEHFCAVQHHITCSAAPIFDCSNRMIGVINMSAKSEKVHPHTLGMVIAAAKAIENQLRIEKALEDVMKTNNIIKTTLSSLPQAIITLDENCRINQINQSALSMFGISREGIINHHVDEVLKCSPPLSDVINRLTVMDKREVMLENDNKNMRCTVDAQPIIHQDQVTGAVIVFHSKETVHRLVNEITGAQAQFTFQSIIGCSKKLEKAKETARMAAMCDSTVLLLGESGTGKELFAQSIHNASCRKGPFIAVNCAAIPRSLIESELFGYEAGSFTGADRNGRPGKFERANGGTIFLDEIGDMPMDLQVILLRVLQEKQIVRIGGFKPIDIDVRVIAATNKDLTARVNEGAFREDLYFRLNVITVNIPPLRERKEDIISLVDYLLPAISRRLGKAITGVSPQALRLLQEYDWPGNVRELENVLERGVVTAHGPILDVKDISESIINGYLSQPISKNELLSLAEIEKRAIGNTLIKVNSVVEAAKILGISRSTLYRKMNQYDIPYQDGCFLDAETL